MSKLPIILLTTLCLGVSTPVLPKEETIGLTPEGCHLFAQLIASLANDKFEKKATKEAQLRDADEANLPERTTLMVKHIIRLVWNTEITSTDDILMLANGFQIQCMSQGGLMVFERGSDI